MSKRRNSVSEMTEAITKVAGGDYSVRIEPSGKHDELDALAAGINRMINDIKHCSEELERQKDCASNMVNVLRSITSALLITNPDKKIISANPAAVSMLGYCEQELINKPVSSIFTEKRKFKNDMMDLLKNGEVINKERQWRSQSGRKIPVVFSCSIIKDKYDAVQGIVYVAHDVTEAVRSREKDNREQIYRELRVDMWKMATDKGIKSEKEMVDRLFRLVGRKIKPSRICLDRFNHKKEAVIIQEWVKKGQKPSRKDLKYPEKIWRHFTDEEYVHGTPDDFLKRAVPGVLAIPFRKLVSAAVKKEGIKNIIIFPFKVDGILEGFVAFDWCESDDKQWEQGEIHTGLDLCKILSFYLSSKRAREAIIESEERFRALTESTSDLIWEIDENSRYTYVSPKVRDLLGYGPDKIIGKTFFALMTPKSARQVRSEFKRFSKIRKSFAGLENICLHKSSGVVMLETSGVPVFGLAGNFRGYRGISRDITRRKMAEENLRENEEKFRVLLENAPIGIYYHDFKGKLLYGNRKAEEIAGYKREELEGRQFLRLNLIRNKKELSRAVRNISMNVRGKATGPDEFTLRRKDGTDCTVEINTEVVSIGGQGVVLGLVNDISERRKAEQALMESEGRFREISDQLPTIICETDIDGKITYVNRAGFETFGYTRRDFERGVNVITNLAHPADREKMAANFRTVSQGGEDSRSEYRMLKKDGRELTFIAQSSPIYRNSSPLGWRISLTDISWRRSVEERHHTLVETSPDSIVTLDLKGFITSCNTASTWYTGLAREDMLGMHFTRLGVLKLKDIPKHLKLFGRVLSREKRKEPFETEVEPQGGTKIWVESRVGFLKEAGRVKGVTIISRDITDRKRQEEERKSIEEQLRQSQKMEAIGQLAGGVAHDFNNILGGITNYANLLKMKMDPGANLVRHVEKISNAALKASELTRQLLTFASRAKVEVGQFDVHETIRDTLGILKPTIGKHIDIRNDLQAGNSMVEGDATQTENAFINLTINARDAMPKGGTLSFKTREIVLDKETIYDKDWKLAQGPYIKITLSDTGIGMNKETRRRIFEPFFTTKEVGKGTGLGLASVYGSIKQHRGYIGVKSRKGRGTEFTIYLPLQEKAFYPWDREPGMPVAGRGRILFIDNDRLVRESTSEMLMALGYEVVCCGDGDEAVKYYRSNHKKIDVLILDVVFTKLGGRDCLHRIRSVNPGVAVILTSGYKDIRQKITGEGEDSGMFIEKPFKIQALSRKVARAFKKEELHDQDSRY
ncbi:PAS domain S-box protein [Fibrobacterota bacterium]